MIRDFFFAMSAPRRRSRRLAPAATATPSSSTPPPTRLLDLPTDLLVRVFSRCDPADIARVAAVSLLFHASLALEGIRLWAQERGFELPAQPEGEGCAVRWLCFAALLCESNPPARAAAGDRHSVFIDGEGRLSSCGSAYGEPGLLGHGEGVTRLNTPTKLPSPLLGGERAVSVAAGDSHNLAVTTDGAVWSWGGGDFGKLGHGDEQHQCQPKKIEALAGQRVVAVTAGDQHNLAITADGAVWSWGDRIFGKLGHGDQQAQWQPQKIEAFAGRRVVAVSAGAHHSLALTADGALWSWGSGLSGRLGHGDTQEQLLPKKVEAFASQRVIALSAGLRHSLALTADGAVWSWGFASSGRLGHGDQQHQHLPKKIEAFAGQRVVAVSAGRYHSLALTADGAVWSWGGGGYGQLGHSDEQIKLLPKKIDAFAGQRVVAVSAGHEHSLTLTADGAVWSWGCGYSGQLGHSDELNKFLPKKIEVWASRPPTPASSDGEDNSDGDDSDSDE